MDDNNQNLENFFRDKLSEKTSSTDAWDKPDTAVWASAQTQIPAYPREKKLPKTLFAYLAIGVIGLPLCAYLCFLQHKIEQLEFAQTKQSEKIQTLLAKTKENSTFPLGEKPIGLADKSKEETIELHQKFTVAVQHSVIKNTLFNISTNESKKGKNNADKANGKLNQKISQNTENDYFTNNKIQKYLVEQPILSYPSTVLLPPLNKTIGNRILSKNQEESSLEFIEKNRDACTENRTNFSSKEQSLSVSILALSQALIFADSKIQHEKISVLQSKIQAIIQPKRKRAHSYAIGYSFGFKYLTIPVKTAIKDQITNNDQSLKNYTVSPSHAFSFGFSPLKNFYIKSGLHTTNVAYNQKTNFEIKHDKSTVFTKPNGLKGFNIELDKNTLFSQDRSTIDVIMPPSVDLQNGSILTLNLEEYRNFSMIQIPLGFAYSFGKNSLKIQTEAGMLWNKITFKDYKLLATVYSKDEKLLVEKLVSKKSTGISKQFYSAYSGLGLNYNFSGPWNIHLGAQFDYNFIQTNTATFKRTAFFGKALNAGLHYTF